MDRVYKNVSKTLKILNALEVQFKLKVIFSFYPLIKI
jgi:hypothetical protein